MIESEKVTWRIMLINAFGTTGDNFKDTEITLSEEELDVEFDCGHGGSEGKPFTAWSENFVYFPTVYDGAEWVSWVPRNPNGKVTHHVGGE